MIINKYDENLFKSNETLETLIIQPNIGLVEKEILIKQFNMTSLIDSTLKNISTSTKLVIGLNLQCLINQSKIEALEIF